MSKEPVYRIKIEVIGEEKEGTEINEAMLAGIECSGFVILADKEDTSAVAIHHVSGYDIAEMMSRNGTLMSASFIARALAEGDKYISRDKNKELLDSALKKMIVQ